MEKQRGILEEKAKKLAASGSAAAGDLKVGFSAALKELKKAITDAKQKFE